jgi:hypothetical protein
MLDAVVECLVKRQNTIVTYIARFFMISFDAILLAASLLVFVYLPAFVVVVFVFIGLGWLVTWLVIKYTSVEFEYSYFDEELTIDKIYNKSKRKRVGRFALARLEYIVPADSPRLQGKQKDNALVLDCSAKDPELKDYTFYIMEEGKKPVFFTITPNEELMEMIGKKYSRKMVD